MTKNKSKSLGLMIIITILTGNERRLYVTVTDGSETVEPAYPPQTARLISLSCPAATGNT